MKKILSIIIIINSYPSFAQDNFFNKNYLLGSDSEMIPYEIHLSKYADSFYLSAINCSTANVNPDSTLLFSFDKQVIKDVLKTKISNAGSRLTDDELNKSINKIYNDLKSFIYQPKIVITGNGLVNFTGSEKNAFTSAATAGFGLRVTKENGIELGIIGTVTETRDTITSTLIRDFGASILVPGIRKFSIMVNYRSLYAFNDQWGYGIFVNSTPMIWQTDTAKSKNSNVYDSLTDIRSVTPITIEAYLSFTIINVKSQSNPVRISFDFGPTFKYLGGDKLKSSERKFYLGSQQTCWVGVFCGLDLRFSGSHAYFYANYIPAIGKNSANIDGLTQFQIIGGLGLAANIADLSKK